MLVSCFSKRPAFRLAQQLGFEFWLKSFGGGGAELIADREDGTDREVVDEDAALRFDHDAEELSGLRKDVVTTIGLELTRQLVDEIAINSDIPLSARKKTEVSEAIGSEGVGDENGLLKPKRFRAQTEGFTQERGITRWHEFDDDEARVGGKEAEASDGETAPIVHDRSIDADDLIQIVNTEGCP